MSYHTKMLTHYYALHFIWQGKPPTSFSVSQGNLTSRLFFHMQTPSFGSGPPPFAHRRPPRAPRPRRVGATSYTDPPDAVPDPPRRQWPPWAPSSSAARGHQLHRPAGRSTGSTPPAEATLGASSSAARGHLLHRPAGRSTGSPPPAEATLGPSSSAARGHLLHRPAGRSTGSTPPAEATLGPSSSAARGHLLHRPAGRSTGSPPPAVATLGAELVGGPGPPATPAAVSATGA